MRFSKPPKRAIVLLLLVAVAASITASVAVAQTGDQPTNPKIKLQVPIPKTGGGFVTEVEDYAEYLLYFYVFFVGAVAVLAVIMMMFGGFQWLTAAGNQSRISNAQTTINSATIGLILALTSYLLLRLINPALVQLRVPYLTGVAIIQQRETIYCTAGDRTERAGQVVPAGSRFCGEQFDVIGGQVGRFCIGADCTSANMAQGRTVCFNPAPGNPPFCDRPENHCVNALTSKEECRVVDARLPFDPHSPDNFGCRPSPVVGVDACVYSRLLTCPEGKNRVVCNYQAGSLETDCWQGNRSRIVVEQEHEQGARAEIYACQDTSRATRGAEAICCADLRKSQVNCSGQRVGNDVPVDCGQFNAQQNEQYQGGGTQCNPPNRCWVNLDFVR